MNLVNRNYIRNKKLVRTLHKSIIIEITRKCHKYSSLNNSMGCSHCFLDPLRQQSINRNLLKKLLSYSHKHFYTIGLVGGEPFLELEMLLYVLKKYPNNLINIFTSGEVLSSKIINELEQFSNVVLTISLHGLEHHHNNLAGENSYKKINSNIIKLNNAKIKWNRKVVAYSGNIEYILSQNFERDSLLLGCEFIDVCRYYSLGAKPNNSLKISESEFTELDDKLKDLTKRGIGIYPESYGNSCKSLPTIDINGYIQSCPYMSSKSNSVLEIDNSNQFISQITKNKKRWDDQNDGTYYCNLMKNYF